jgi:hypothetical protein
MQIQEILSRVVENNSLHASWLNSLSYLEYRGFRKIARSQTTENMSMDILFHAMEEVRHAVFFKKHAVKFGGDSYKNYRSETLLCETAIKSYFYQLDQGVVRILERFGKAELHQAAYCLITWLIEERALLVYGEYEKTLRAASLDLSLAGILGEEKNHLSEMVQASRYLLEQEKVDADLFLKLESQCFHELWNQIENEVSLACAQLTLL